MRSLRAVVCLVVVAAVVAPAAAQTYQALNTRLEPIDALSDSADTHRWNGRFDQAIALYREAIAINPGNARARRGLGQALDFTGQHADARRNTRQSLKERRNLPSTCSWISRRPTSSTVVSTMRRRRCSDGPTSAPRGGSATPTRR
jgi:Flp pilus assembly protein TadD